VTFAGYSSIRSKIAVKLCYSWLTVNRVAVRGNSGMLNGNREIDARDVMLGSYDT